MRCSFYVFHTSAWVAFQLRSLVGSWRHPAFFRSACFQFSFKFTTWQVLMKNVFASFCVSVKLTEPTFLGDTVNISCFLYFCHGLYLLALYGLCCFCNEGCFSCSYDLIIVLVYAFASCRAQHSQNVSQPLAICIQHWRFICHCRMMFTLCR